MEGRLKIPRSRGNQNFTSLTLYACVLRRAGCKTAAREHVPLDILFNSICSSQATRERSNYARARAAVLASIEHLIEPIYHPALSGGGGG